MTPEWIALLVAVGIVGLGIRIIAEDERLVVIRSGKPLAVLDPGMRWVVPFVDRTLHVPLTRVMPGWERLDAAVIHQQLIDRVRSGDLPTA